MIPLAEVALEVKHLDSSLKRCYNSILYKADEKLEYPGSNQSSCDTPEGRQRDL